MDYLQYLYTEHSTVLEFGTLVLNLIINGLPSIQCIRY